MMTISSFGIALTDYKHILLTQRRDSIEYICIIRGNYKDRSMLYHFCTLLTKSEYRRLVSQNFNELWNGLWQNEELPHFARQFIKARDKFFEYNVIDILKHSIYELDLFDAPEYCIPKGRKKKNESEHACALREFREETELKRIPIHMTNSTWVEYFKGTDGENYSTRYFLCTTTEDLSQYHEYKVGNYEVQQLICPKLCDSRQYIRLYRHELSFILFTIYMYLKKTI